MFEILQQGLNGRFSSKKYRFHYSEMEIQHLAHMDNSINVNQTHILLMLTPFLRIKTQWCGKAGESNNFFPLLPMCV